MYAQVNKHIIIHKKNSYVLNTFHVEKSSLAFWFSLSWNMEKNTELGSGCRKWAKALVEFCSRKTGKEQSKNKKQKNKFFKAKVKIEIDIKERLKKGHKEIDNNNAFWNHLGNIYIVFIYISFHVDVSTCACALKWYFSGLLLWNAIVSFYLCLE